MKREIKIFSNKKGIEDIEIIPKYLLYLGIFIAFLLIIFGILYLMKKNILT